MRVEPLRRHVRRHLAGRRGIDEAWEDREEDGEAGVFAEGAARVVAAALLSQLHGGERPEGYGGRGSCYIEFGAGRVGRVDVDFLSGPKPTGTFQEPSRELVAEKQHFGASRRARWFNG